MAVGSPRQQLQKNLRAAKQECAELAHTRRRCLASQVVCWEERPAVSASQPARWRGGALAEQFGSVARSFPWSVIVIEALSPMVFIHTRRIIIVPGHQYLLGFFPPLFESHRRLVSYVCVAAGRDSVASHRASDYALFFFANGRSQHFDLGQEPLNLRSPSCRSGACSAA